MPEPYGFALPGWVGGFEPLPRPRPLRLVFREPLYLLTAAAGGLGLYVLYYWLLRQVTTLRVFNEMTASQPVYLYAYHGLTLAASILFGMALAVALHGLRLRAASRASALGGTAGGTFTGALAAACPVCGSLLLPLVGVSGGLAVFPLAGLELKMASVGLFGLALLHGLRRLSRACASPDCPAPPPPRRWAAALPGAALVVLVLLLVPLAAAEFNPVVQAQAYMRLLERQSMNTNQAATSLALQGVHQGVVDKVLPPDGFKTRIRWGDSIPRLMELGVIDIAKFEKAVNGLTEEQRRILTQPSNETLSIDANNSWFMVTVLWPLGLANKNPVLEKSPMATRSGGVFNFASTGGWNLGRVQGGLYYNRFPLVNLTPEQQALLDEVAPKVYRPCCNNPTNFPDCNHGAAMLGLLTLGASQGLSREELFDAAKKFNAFWFPQQYSVAALYLKLGRGLDWDQIPAEEIMGANYSSISGWLDNAQTPFQQLGLSMSRGGAKCGA